MDPFLSKLDQTIRTHRLLPPRAVLLVAVSGGVDSMTLLHALVRLRGQWGWRIQVAHFNHRLRGAAADADERLVRRQCSKLGLTVHVGAWARRSQKSAIKEQGVEQAARHARREFLGRIARQVKARHLVFAHHADDQVETFFVRLLRGAGSRGLGGMRAKSRHGAPLDAWIVRPLLNFTRPELAAWAGVQRVAFRDDASNADLRFLRNRVRLRLLPLLHELFPATNRGVLLRTMQTLADEADWLQREASRYLETPAARRAEFLRCPPALQRQVILLQLERRGLPFNWDLVDHLRTNPGIPITGPGDHVLSCDEHGRLAIRCPTGRRFPEGRMLIRLEGGSGTSRFGSVRVNWACRRLTRKPVYRAGSECFDADTVGESITLRHWQPGDRFQPSGLPQPVKLQDLFTNAKVPRAERERRLVGVAAAGEIFWVEGLRIAERFKLSPATRRCLVWSWRRDSPGLRGRTD